MDDYPAMTSESMNPNLCLDDRDLPEVKKLEVGKTYTITLQARVTSKNEREARDKKTRTHADLSLSNIKIGRGKSYEKSLGQMAGE